MAFYSANLGFICRQDSTRRFAMPRSLREHDKFCINHVMIRGNRKANIFFKNQDYGYFCHRLKTAIDKYACRLHLFCLMTNHVHLVLETTHISLSKIMQNINSSYAAYIHRELGVKGSLFEGRYKSKPVHDDRYLIELCHYVHMNPVKANIVSDIDEYPWSSHCVYAKKKDLLWVESEHLLELLKVHVKSETPYQSFIHDRESCYESIYTGYDRDGFLVGTKDAKMKRKKRKVQQLVLSQLSVEDILNVICDEMVLSKTKVISISRKPLLLLARCLTVHFAHNFACHPLYEIAPILNREPDTLTKSMCKVLFSEKKMSEAEYWLDRLYQVFSRGQTPT